MINLKIVTPNGLFKELKTPIINVGSNDGQRGLLSGHIATCFMLKTSMLETEEDSIRKYYAISDGLLFLKDDECKILVDEIIDSNDIDVNKVNNDLKDIHDKDLILRAKNMLKVAEYAK